MHFTLRVLFVVCACLTISGVAGAEEECAPCGQPRFPEERAYLAEQGLPADDYELLLSWKEAAPNAPGGFIKGFRIQPRPGGDPFDLYADESGRLLTEEEAAAWGVSPKKWDLDPTAVDAEIAPGGPAEPLPSLRAAHLKSAAPRVALPPLDLAPIVAEDAAEASTPAGKGVKRIGVVRDLDKPLDLSPNSRPAAWRALPDGGLVGTVVIESPEARAVRLHLSELTLPDGGHVAVYDASDPDEVYGPYTTLDANPDGLWTATCFSSAVAVECVLPAGTLPDSVRLVVDSLVHVYVPFDSLPWAKQAAGPCHRDVTCEPDWAVTAKGVGGMSFIKQRSSYWCTGALLADTDPDTHIPYFLTAHHCIGDATVAATLEVYWLYQTATCNGPRPDVENSPKTLGGADFLAGSPFETGNDFALLRLKNAPPAGITFLGWTTDTLSNNTSIASIHHPNGDYKRISFGHINQTVPGLFDISPAQYWGIYWDLGVTEGGSSGSPLFEEATQRVVGQLWGGISSCDFPSEPDAYGRFDRTYPVIQNYLGAAGLRVTRPNGGEVWYAGTTQDIEWNPGEDTGDRVKIELLRGDYVVLLIASSEDNDGQYSWSVPSDQSPATDYRVRITPSRTGAVADVSDDNFSIQPKPTLNVNSISPNQGTTAGGVAVTISGSGFTSGGTTTVAFGGAAATQVAVVNASTITAVTPAHEAGTVDVTVTGPGGISGTLANGFTYVLPDADGDGIPDSVEGTGDADGDGKPNYLDTDSDNDGIPDSVEGTDDPDNDGKPNYLDTDSDGDGILDRFEGTEDPDNDGKPNYLDLDSDGDGIPDKTEGRGDPDGDRLPNFLDLDSDNDGIPDSIEGTADADNDGKPNYLDTDSDNDGMSDKWENENGTDPYVNDAAVDLDDDGFSNLEEFTYRTDPQNGASFPTASALTLSRSQLELNPTVRESTFVIGNAGQLPLRWAISSSDARVTVDPAQGTGSATVRVRSDDFSGDYTATLTITNQDDAGDVKVVTVNVNSRLPGDVNDDDRVNAVDVQVVINSVLGISQNDNSDINKDGEFNAVDVQFVINAVLGSLS